MNNFIVRTITGVIFVTAIVVCFLKPVAMVFLFSLVTGMTVWEFAGLVNKRENVQINQFISSVAGVLLFLAMAVHARGLDTLNLAFMPWLATIIYLLVSELYLKAKDPISNWAYTMMAQLYIALPFSLLNVLAFQFTNCDLPWLLPLSVFIFLWVNDSGAYCCGSLLGRHKLFPRVSPGKSWEGSIGGAVFVLAAAWFISFYTQSHGIVTNLTALQWMGMGLVVVVFGTWGDLIESLFKRTLGIKDSGNVLPGHGGMLDRFDSSLLAIPAVVVYLFTLALL
ncbi:MAG: phosphatidate cytidylyltransferase [Prevotella sp.]|jgi:phosphatidate cytidylyltransferase|nr:phosphatidate cytidylyltransferase [Prevotella sp.]MBR3067150.1 phosphatidate cytidylyltransferase [Prevotella sp.]MCR5198642.1 phosphatidate cytidylyltransferase [Prevotella sp.]